MMLTQIEALRSPRAWAIDLAACVAAGAVLGILGPFGSFFNDALPMRVVFWVGSLLVSGLVFGTVVRWLWPRAIMHGVPVWAWLPLVVLVVSMPVALVTRTMAVTLWPHVDAAVSWIEFHGQTTLIGFAYLSIYVALRSRPVAPARSHLEREPQILVDLPARLGRNLVCMTMEDHYVRLHTSEGSSLVLMTLAQAIRQMGGVKGMQVHRSWWVAQHAVCGVECEGRKLRLRLVNGLKAPVSRTAVARLRAAGWLDD